MSEDIPYVLSILLDDSRVVELEAESQGVAMRLAGTIGVDGYHAPGPDPAGFTYIPPHRIRQITITRKGWIVPNLSPEPSLRPDRAPSLLSSSPPTSTLSNRPATPPRTVHPPSRPPSRNDSGRRV